MSIASKNLGRLILLAIIAALLLAACDGGGGSDPTQSPDAIYTAAALTVQAQLTEVAALTPSPTNTEEPTSTPEPSPTAEGDPSAAGTVLPTLAPLVQPTQPLAQQPAASAPDKCEYVSQSPSDGTKYLGLEYFTASWRLKNTGTTTWTKDYMLRHYGGNRFGADDTKLPREVKPNETIDLGRNMRAPKDGGDFNSIWVLTNAEGTNFCPIYLSIRVSGTVPNPPDKPGVSVDWSCNDSNTEARVDISWENVKDEAGYKVYANNLLIKQLDANEIGASYTYNFGDGESVVAITFKVEAFNNYNSSTSEKYVKVRCPKDT